jgi:prevent-host-death family protein
MKTVSVTEFKAHCLEFLNQVAKTGQALLLTKRGRPTAMVTPPPPPKTKRWVPGQFADRMQIVEDVVPPFDEKWEPHL